MRLLAQLAAALLLVVFLAVLSGSAASDNGAAVAAVSDVRVALAVVEGHRTTNSPLHVIIENASGEPQSHFEEWNSWGYGNLTVEWTDAAGNTGKVAKVPGVWTVNFPSTVTLQPGDALVREVSFDSKLWQGWPEVPSGATLTLQVTYHSSGEPAADGWTGSVTAKVQTVLFR